MPQNQQNNVVSLRENQETSQKRAYERMPGEPAMWFQRFKSYCVLGRGRSIQAIWDQEQQASASTKTLIPGNWRKAASQWKWVERTEAYDEDQRAIRHKSLVAFLDHEGTYVTAAQRINALDSLLAGLMHVTLENPLTKNDYTLYLATMRQAQSVLRDIRREMMVVERGVSARRLADVL